MKAKQVVKTVIDSCLSPLGFKLQRKPPSNRFVTKKASLQVLKDLGFDPKTVIDVGVRYGTPELYETFPDAKHLLVEPVKEFETQIQEMYSGVRDVEMVWAAASSHVGTSPLSVSYGLTHAQLGEAKGGRWDPELTRMVPVVRLDQVCEERDIEGPYLIKVDVDGKDLDVLRGAGRILEETDCVIIESRTRDIGDRARFLEERSFFLWDVVDLMYTDQILWQVDLVFCHHRLDIKQFVPRIDLTTNIATLYDPTYDDCGIHG